MATSMTIYGREDISDGGGDGDDDSADCKKG